MVLSVLTWFLQYIRLGIFASFVLLGVQIPGFVDQYTARIDAHLKESSTNLAGFQRTADLHFAGDLNALIRHYESSEDKIFQTDASNLQSIYQRHLMFSEEMMKLSENEFTRIFHIIWSGSREVLERTAEQFRFTVPLHLDALLWGAGLAVFLSIFMDICIGICRRVPPFSRHRATKLT